MNRINEQQRVLGRILAQSVDVEIRMMAEASGGKQYVCVPDLAHLDRVNYQPVDILN